MSTRLKYVQGKVGYSYREGGLFIVAVDGSELRLLVPNDALKVRRGDVVRLMLREIANDGVFKVVAWQRAGDPQIHQGASHVIRKLVFLGLVSYLVGYVLELEVLLFVGMGALAIQLVLASWRYCIRLRFRNDLYWVPEPQTSHESSDLRKSIPAASLHLEVPKENRSAPFVASSLPSEILEFTQDAIIIWEMDGGGILYWNRAAESLYGFSRQEACGQVTHELLKTGIAAGVDEIEQRLSRFGVWIGVLTHTCKNGRRVQVEARLSLMSQEHGPWLVLEVNRDVTALSNSEAARRALEQQLAALLK